MDILDDMGVSKLSAKVFLFFFLFKGYYSFKAPITTVSFGLFSFENNFTMLCLFWFYFF